MSSKMLSFICHLHYINNCQNVNWFLCGPSIDSSVQFSRSVVSDSLRPHESQHARPPCPKPTPGVHSNPCPSSQWCHPTISSSVVPFSFCPQSFPASGSFPTSQFFASGWAEYWSFSFSISLSNEYSGLISFRMDWLDLPAVQGTLKSLFQHHSSKASILLHLAFCVVQISHPYMTIGKTIALTRQTFVGKVKSLAFNMLSRFFITFLPRSTGLFISCHHLQWFGSPKSSLPLFPLFLHLFTMKWWDRMPWCLFSECWALSQLFHSPLSPSSRGSLVILCFLP